MTKTHIMVDLETWGTTPGSDIRSIGAVVFDPITGALGDEFYVNVENAAGRWRNGEFCPELATSDKDRRYPLTRDPSTVKWWGGQSPEAQQRLTTDVVDLQEGLLHFANWWHMQEGQINPATLWAHGPHFDEAILAACYRAVGVDQPWHYRAPRDCRTIYEAAGDNIYLPFEGVEHDALADAKHQARCVIEAYRRIRNPIGCPKHFEVWQETLTASNVAGTTRKIGTQCAEYEDAQEIRFLEDCDDPAPDKHDYRRIVIRSVFA